MKTNSLLNMMFLENDNGACSGSVANTLCIPKELCEIGCVCNNHACLTIAVALDMILLQIPCKVIFS